MKTRLTFFFFVITTLYPTIAGVTVKPQFDGLHVSGDSDTIKFTLPYPNIVSSDQKKVYKPASAHVDSETLAIVKYDGGAEIDLTLDASGTVVLKTTNLPADAKMVQFAMPLSLDLRNGATFQPGDGQPQSFPPDQAPKPHMYQGNVVTLTLRDSGGKGVAITIPPASYMEVNDEREWGTKSFFWMSIAGIKDTMIYKFEDAAPPPPAAPATNAAPANP